MAHTDTNVLNEHAAEDPVSDSLPHATDKTDTYVQLNPERFTHGSATEQQLADERTTATFTFVNTLAADISSGNFELPSWPEIVVQIQRVLENDECSADQLVRLIGSEPVLAARLLKVVNTELNQDSRKPIKDLRTVVSQMGVDSMRGVAISLAAAQSCHGLILRPVRRYLAKLWHHSVRVAAIAYVLAKRFTKISPDEAHLAGLLHNIGKLYVLMRIRDNPVFIDNERTLQEIMDAWHTSIGGEIIESWKFSEELAAAVRDHELCDLEGAQLPNLTDVVSAANLLVNAQKAEPSDQIDLSKFPACRRLKLHTLISVDVMRASDAEVQRLHQMLGI